MLFFFLSFLCTLFTFEYGKGKQKEKIYEHIVRSVFHKESLYNIYILIYQEDGQYRTQI